MNGRALCMYFVCVCVCARWDGEDSCSYGLMVHGEADCLKTGVTHRTYLGSVPHCIKREKVILSNLISVTEIFQAGLHVHV